MIIKAIGLIIFIVGLVLTLYTGLGFVTKEKVLDIGSFQLTEDKEHTTNWSPFIGLGTMVIGGILFFSGSKKHFRHEKN